MQVTSPCFLALDAGTSSVKAAIFDAAGSELAVHVEEYSLLHPAPEWVELDPEVYWEAAQAAIRAVLAAAPIPPAAITALGVTSQGETLIMLDDQGRPLRPAIVWLDQRAQEEAAQIAAEFPAADVYRVTGQHEIVPCWTAAKIRWLQRHEPHIFAQTATFLLVADYLVYRLTGERVSDHALNPSTLYYDLEAGDWWEPMLAALGIRREQLPRLVLSGTPVGRVRATVGLDPATLVVTAPIDQVAGAVGAGNLVPGQISETTGSALAICATCATPQYDPQQRLGLYRHALADAFVLLPWIPTAGMLLRWFRDCFSPAESFAALDLEAAGIPAGSEGLLVLPHFSGALSPELNPLARGVFYGVTLAHTRAHFTRAILEAVAYSLRDHIDLLAALGVPATEIRSLGGGAHSDLWLQIKADVLNRPIVTMDTDEVTALGVAMLAAVGAGIYPDLQAAATAMTRSKKRLAPNPEQAAAYDQAYQEYRRLNQRIVPYFGDSR